MLVLVNITLDRLIVAVKSLTLLGCDELSTWHMSLSPFSLSVLFFNHVPPPPPWHSSSYPQRHWDWFGKRDLLFSLTLKKTFTSSPCPLLVSDRTRKVEKCFCLVTLISSFQCPLWFSYCVIQWSTVSFRHSSPFRESKPRFPLSPWVIWSNPLWWNWKGICPCILQWKHLWFMLVSSPRVQVEKEPLRRWKAPLCCCVDRTAGMVALKVKKECCVKTNLRGHTILDTSHPLFKVRFHVRQAKVSSVASFFGTNNISTSESFSRKLFSQSIKKTVKETCFGHMLDKWDVHGSLLLLPGGLKRQCLSRVGIKEDILSQADPRGWKQSAAFFICAEV